MRYNYFFVLISLIFTGCLSESFPCDTLCHEMKMCDAYGIYYEEFNYSDLGYSDYEDFEHSYLGHCGSNNNSDSACREALKVQEQCSDVDLSDFDRDGFSEDEDCDNENADIFPGAEEICSDSIDNNCDGMIDAEDPSCL